MGWAGLGSLVSPPPPIASLPSAQHIADGSPCKSHALLNMATFFSVFNSPNTIKQLYQVRALSCLGGVCVGVAGQRAAWPAPARANTTLATHRPGHMVPPPHLSLYRPCRARAPGVRAAAQV
jgi:hypothetical protein